MDTFLIAAWTDAETYKNITGLALDRGFVQLANRRVGGLYPHDEAERVSRVLRAERITHEITPASNYAGGLRKLSVVK